MTGGDHLLHKIVFEAAEPSDDQNSIWSSSESDDEVDRITQEFESNGETGEGNDQQQNIWGFLNETILQDETLMNPIEHPVDKSKGEILLMLLEYILRHNLSQTAISHLFMLVNNIFSRPIFADSIYFLEKLFNPKGQATFHAICSKCCHYVGQLEMSNPQQMKCSGCNEVFEWSELDKKEFFVTMNVSSSIKKLLETHQSYYDDVVRNKTCREVDKITDIYDGKLYRKFISSLNVNERYSYATGIFNVDGAPVFEGSKCSIYPIQVIINEIPAQERIKNPILCGLWFGKSKPTTNTYLLPFVAEMNKLSSNGVSCNILGENRCIKLYSLCCSVDTVARAPLQGLMQFNAYYGCHWCLHPGEYVNTSMKYPLIFPEPESRDNVKTIEQMEEAFETKQSVQGVKDVTCLINLNQFQIVSGFIVEYMHCVLQGVAKQLTNYWFSDSCFIKVAKRKMVSERLKQIKPPRQVARLPRPIEERSYWKAREWENWLLFYSAITLKGILKQEYLDHWCILVEAMHILLGDQISPSLLNKAELNICEFVCKTQLLYGESAMTFNIHILSHICQCVANWGPLWATSAFSFESGNGKMLKTIQNANGIPFQICRTFSFNLATSMIRNTIQEKCKTAVLQFSKKINGLVHKTFQDNDGIRYFGKSSYLNEYWTEKLEMLEPKCYNKILKDGCVYTSVVKKKIRSDDSYAQINDGTIVRIQNFIVDFKDFSKAFALVRKLKIFNIATSKFFFKRHIGEDENLEHIPIKNIVRNCVNINIKTNESYVYVFPNSLKY